jgi:hypothetical protein
MREQGVGLYHIKLPAISLSETGTNTLRVRNLPAFLADQFKYVLCMNAPSVDLDAADTWKPGVSEAQVPWRDAVITLIFRKLDDSRDY